MTENLRQPTVTRTELCLTYVDSLGRTRTEWSSDRDYLDRFAARVARVVSIETATHSVTLDF